MLIARSTRNTECYKEKKNLNFYNIEIILINININAYL